MSSDQAKRPSLFFGSSRRNSSDVPPEKLPLPHRVAFFLWICNLQTSGFALPPKLVSLAMRNEEGEELIQELSKVAASRALVAAKLEYAPKHQGLDRQHRFSSILKSQERYEPLGTVTESDPDTPGVMVSHITLKMTRSASRNLFFFTEEGQKQVNGNFSAYVKDMKSRNMGYIGREVTLDVRYKAD